MKSALSYFRIIINNTGIQVAGTSYETRTSYPLYAVLVLPYSRDCTRVRRRRAGGLDHDIENDERGLEYC